MIHNSQERNIITKVSINIINSKYFYIFIINYTFKFFIIIFIFLMCKKFNDVLSFLKIICNNKSFTRGTSSIYTLKYTENHYFVIKRSRNQSSANSLYISPMQNSIFKCFTSFIHNLNLFKIVIIKKSVILTSILFN